MRRLGTLIALVCAAGALLVPAAAQASHAQALTFEATSDLKDPATRDQAFKDVAALGVHSMRVVLYWHDVAPEPDSRVKPKFDETDPASYNWGAYDPVIDGIKARGWQLLLTVSGPVPRWATNGARDTLTRPSPAEFQKFVHAVATHYGAKVDTWSIWNEPTGDVEGTDVWAVEHGFAAVTPLSAGEFDATTYDAWKARIGAK